MRNQVKIEGGGKGGQTPTETFEKNLGFISNNIVTHLGPAMSWKKMQEDFVFLAPIVAADVKPWNDRNTNNAGTKLSKEKPLNLKKQSPIKPLSPGKKRKKSNR